MNLALRPARLSLVPPVALARVEVFHRFSDAEPHWRTLARSGALATAYQRYDFLALWQRHLGEAESVTPLILVGFDAAGAPLVLLPLGVRRRGALRIAGFLGGKHANFNLGLWRRDFAGAVDRDMVARLLAALEGMVDALVLLNQPLDWEGTPNPMACWPHHPSPSMGHSGALLPDFDALMRERVSSSTRRKIRKKGENLAAAGEVTFARAMSAEEARRVLVVFFGQKIARMRMIGQPDVFDDPKLQRFFDAAATESGVGGPPPIEVYSLSVGGTIIATFAGVADHERFSAMFNSIVPDRFQHESPGEQTLVYLVKACCERGLKTFDLGVGEARYKGLFCDRDEPLFDSFIALSPAGRFYVMAARTAAALKRRIKHTPAVWRAVETLRRLRSRLKA
jgi:CelD/BcsL family acetyltransferase involved in cellulose biosynthesis